MCIGNFYRRMIEKDKKMKLRATFLHQLNKQHKGNNWTIMTPAYPCSFMVVIARSENLEGRDFHFLK